MAISLTKRERRAVYDRTTGYCHLCGKKLALTNYGKVGERAAWEIEHSNARANGGTDHRNNLYAACIPCNRRKGCGPTRSARAQHGRSRAPLSRTARKRVKAANLLAGASLGLAAGSIFGPLGRVVGTAIGAYLGHRKNPDK